MQLMGHAIAFEAPTQAAHAHFDETPVLTKEEANMLAKLFKMTIDGVFFAEWKGETTKTLLTPL